MTSESQTDAVKLQKILHQKKPVAVTVAEARAFFESLPASVQEELGNELMKL